MVGCSAYGCKNRSEQGFVMKVFPRDPKRRKEWVAKVRRENWIPTNNSYLCEVHFEPDMWEKTREDGSRKLKPHAVPTIFSFNETKPKKKPPTKRKVQRPQRSRTTGAEPGPSSREDCASDDSGRDDLLEKAKNLHKSHKICSDHLEDCMVTNQRRKRSMCSAYPTTFPRTETSSNNEHNYSRSPMFRAGYCDPKLDSTPRQAVVSEIEKMEDSISLLDNAKQSDNDSAAETNINIDQTKSNCIEVIMDSDNESEPSVIESLNGRHERDNSKTVSPVIPINSDGSLSPNSCHLDSKEASFAHVPDFPLKQIKTDASNTKTGSQPGDQTFVNIVPVVPGMSVIFVNQQPCVNVKPARKKEVQCRTCGGIFNEDDCLSISDVPENSCETIKELLNKCVPFIYSKLKNTERICGKCIIDLKICVDFIEKCVRVDNALQEKLHSISADQLRDCTETPYVCKMCSKKFLSLDTLLAHQKKMKDGPSCTFTCRKCRNVFRNPKLHQCHLNRNPCSKEHLLELRGQTLEARKEETEVREIREHEIEEERETERRKTAFLCDICGKTLPTRLKRHMKYIHGPKDVKKRFMCDQCPRFFRQKSFLQQHQDFQHKNIIKYRCDECNMNFLSAYNLKSHMITKHSNEKPHKCETCNVSFVRKDHYQRHLNSRQHKFGIKPPNSARVSVRAKGRPCICKYCNKVFKNDNSLKLHYHSHLNYRPYKCSHCSLRFTNHKLREKHKKTHTDPSGHLRCDVCYSKFSDEEKLKAHKSKSKHKLNFKCEYCDEGFSRRYLLGNHLAEKHSDNREEEQLHKLLSNSLEIQKL